MQYLTFEDILALNQWAAYKLGFRFGLISREGLQGVIERPTMKVDDYEPFPTLWGKAAVIMDTMLKNQPFVEGNTVTALLATDLFLRLNQQRLQTNVEDIEHLQSVQLHQLTIPQIAEWLKSRCTEIV